MVTELEVIEYLNKLPSIVTASFSSLSEEDQAASIFHASELLGDYYNADKLTARAISLQVLYMAEAENEDFAKYKRHGITSASQKDVSVSFGGSVSISPEVLKILGDPGGVVQGSGMIGRLI